MKRPKLLGQVIGLSEVVQLLAPYLRGQRRKLIVGCAITAVSLLMRVAQPWPLKSIIDGISLGSAELATLSLTAAAFLAISIAAALSEYAQTMLLAGLGSQLVYAFRADLFRNLLRQSIHFHEKKGEGELLTRVVYDTARLRKGVNNVLTRLLQTVLHFIAVVGVLIWVDAALAAVLAAAGAAAIGVMAYGGSRVRRAARENRKREGKLASLVTDELVAVREFQAFRTDENDHRAFQRLTSKSLKQESKVRRLTSTLLLRVELIMSAGLATGLLLGAYRVAAGVVTPGELVLFAGYATALLPPFFRFARQTAQIGSTLAATDRLRALMEKTPAIAEPALPIVPPETNCDIEFARVSLKTPKRVRGSRKWTLRDVDLQIATGERVLVIGGNGAGKSSLLRLLLRLNDPDAGAVLVSGVDARLQGLAALRGRTSAVLQGTVLFGLSVRQNIAAGRPDASDSEIEGAARRALASSFVEKLPHGFDTIVQRQGRLFSGGERQRIAIARALLRDGGIWLLDEPTTGIDAASASSMTDVLDNATRGRTTLWVSHDLRLLGRMDRVLYLAEGRVVFFGPPEKFHEYVNQANPALTPALVGVS